MAVANQNEAYRELEKDIAGRLSLCQIELTDFMKKSTKRDIKKYAIAIFDNVNARFPQNVQKVLEAFSVFNLDVLPSDSSVSSFTLYGEHETETLHEQFSQDDELNITKSQWHDFKYDMVQMKSKWDDYKTRMTGNKFKLRQSSAEWALQNTVNIYKDNQEFGKVVQLAKIACITPVTNAWPERGTSAVKRIKFRTRSTMRNDLLNALLQISISGPEMKSSNADKLTEKVSLKFQQTQQNKKPNRLAVKTTMKAASTQTVDVEADETSADQLEENLEQSLAKTSEEDYLVTNFEDDFSSDEAI